MEKTIGAFEARRRLGQLIEEAYYKQDHFIIERAGRPMAVLVPLAEYECWRRLAKNRVFAMLDEVHARTAGVSPDELERDVELARRMLNQDLVAEKGA